MDGEALRACADQRAREFPAVERTHPFGPEVDVYKVVGKVFLLIGDEPQENLVTLKARPADGLALCEAHEEVTPGYHMNKRHWITLEGGPSLDEDLVRELVLESYLLVVQGMPRASRPVDPTTFTTPEPGTEERAVTE